MGGVILLALLFGWMTPVITSALPGMISKLYGVSIFPYIWMFLIASFYAEQRDHILFFLKKWWWVFIIVLIFKKIVLPEDIFIAMYPLVNTLLLLNGLLGLAYACPALNIKTDISYGIYIYHMTIINALIALGYIGQYWTVGVVIACTFIMAWISTKTIGRLSIKQKSKLVSNLK